MYFTFCETISLPEDDLTARFLAAELQVTPNIISGDGAFLDGEILQRM